MIHDKTDMEKQVFETVGSAKLLVINSHFTCMCERTGLCFRHGVNKKNAEMDESVSEKKKVK